MGKCIAKNNIVSFYIAVGCVFGSIVAAAMIMVATAGLPWV